MPDFGFEFGGKRYSVTANSPDEASGMIDDVVQHLSNQPPALSGAAALGPQGSPLGNVQTPTVQGSGALNNPAIDLAQKTVENATPVGPIEGLVNGQGHYGQHPFGTALNVLGLAGYALPGMGAVGPATKALMGGMGGAAAGTAAANLGTLAGAGGASPDLQQKLNVQNPIAQTALTMGGGALGAGLGPSIAALPGVAKRAVLGNTVPAGEEASALVNTMGKAFGTPEVPQGPMNTGELRQAMAAGSKQLGGAVGNARNAAFEAAGPPENPTGMVQDALSKALEQMGVLKGPGGYKLGLNPGAKPVVDALENAAPEVTNLAEAYKLKQNLQNAAAQATKPLSTVTDTAPFLKAAGGAVNEAIQNHLNTMAPEQVQALQEANQPFGAAKTIQQMAVKSTAPGGEMSPAKFVSAWKTMTPADKAAKFTPQQIEAFDNLTSQNQGLVQKGVNLLLKLPQMGAKTVLQGTKLGDLMQPSSAAVKFQAPVPNFPSNPLLDIVRGK